MSGEEFKTNILEQQSQKIVEEIVEFWSENPVRQVILGLQTVVNS